MITAHDHPEMRQATVVVRWQVVAPTVVVEEVEVVVATADVTRNREEDTEEIMTVEVEAAGETTGGRVRVEEATADVTRNREEDMEEIMTV